MYTLGLEPNTAGSLPSLVSPISDRTVETPKWQTAQRNTNKAHSESCCPRIEQGEGTAKHRRAATQKLFSRCARGHRQPPAVTGPTSPASRSHEGPPAAGRRHSELAPRAPEADHTKALEQHGGVHVVIVSFFPEPPFGERKIGRSLPLPFRWGSMHPGDMSAVARFYSPWTFVCRVRALSAAQASRQSQGEQQITAQHIHSPPHKSTPPNTLHNFKTHCETLRDTAHTAHTARRCRYTGGHAIFGTTTANRGSDSLQTRIELLRHQNGTPRSGTRTRLTQNLTAPGSSRAKARRNTGELPHRSSSADARADTGDREPPLAPRAPQADHTKALQQQGEGTANWPREPRKPITRRS